MRLRTAIVTAALLVATSGLSVSPAAADVTAACDTALAPGLTWSAPSFLAWGRADRLGADVANAGNAGNGPSYTDGSVALSVDAGTAAAASNPVDHDLEFALTAPAHGAAVHANATWSEVDQTGTVHCSQTAALTIPLGVGSTMRFKPQSLKGGGVTWVPQGVTDCSGIALQAISLTVQQGGVTRRLSAPDQCNPTGAGSAATPDWRLTLKNGRFELHALARHSSFKTVMRYALRVGPRRVASGSLVLVRRYKAPQQIMVANPAFLDTCIHGIYPAHLIGNNLGCDVPGVMTVSLKLA